MEFGFYSAVHEVRANVNVAWRSYGMRSLECRRVFFCSENLVIIMAIRECGAFCVRVEAFLPVPARPAVRPSR